MESPCAGKGAILHAVTTRLQLTKIMLRRQRACASESDG